MQSLRSSCALPGHSSQAREQKIEMFFRLEDDVYMIAGALVGLSSSRKTSIGRSGLAKPRRVEEKCGVGMMEVGQEVSLI
jgi:hypothetical protein